jgi:hypothetical protein
MDDLELSNLCAYPSPIPSRYYDRSQSLETIAILHAVFNGFGTAYYYISRALTRLDQLGSRDLHVTSGLNVGVLILLPPYSWRLIRHLQRERSAPQA